MELAPVLRDFLVRYQQTAVRQTGCRPLAWLRTPMDDALLLPGSPKPGCTCWQPVAWPDGQPALGPAAELFHQSIIDYVSMCQFLEIFFRLPVAHAGSPLSFLHGRTFACCANTVHFPPSRALEEAALYCREHADLPLSYLMASTCDDGEPLMIFLRAQDGEVLLCRSHGKPLELKLGLERFLPKLQFVYDI